MKKILKIAGIVLLSIIAIIGIGLAYLYFAPAPSYKPEKITVEVEYTPERVAEGHRIAILMCKNCHLNENTGKLTGSFMKDVPAMFGKSYSQNITAHPTDGIGNWTDGDLVYFFRTGIKPSGQFAAFMPSLHAYSDEDIYALVSFLRSNHPWLEPTEGRQPKQEYSLLSKILARTVFVPRKYEGKSIPMPDTDNLVEFGRYLVDAKFDCFGCHSASFTSIDMDQPQRSKGYLGGGNEMVDDNGNTIYTANITFDEETGIGTWSLEEFERAVRYGLTKHGALRYPMIPFTELHDLEVQAIYAYLQSVPKIKNQVDRRR